MQIAKLFFNGGSQAVRLPKAFRFEGITEVIIERDGDRIILRASDPASSSVVSQVLGVALANNSSPLWR